MVDITLSGPGKNALSTAMMDSLLARLAAAQGEPVLLVGEGDAFCAGLDLKEIASFDARGLSAYLARLEELVETLDRYPAPTVACVNGHAIAGGCILALCCDHRVATVSPRVKLGLNEVALGVTIPPVTLDMVRRRLSSQQVTTVVLGAALHDPTAALRLGLVDELSEDPLATARARLAALAAHPRAAYVASKAELKGPPLSHTERSARFAQLLPSWSSEDTRARIAAALRR